MKPRSFFTLFGITLGAFLEVGSAKAITLASNHYNLSTKQPTHRLIASAAATASQGSDQYIDNQNAKQQCLGRWRWQEHWDAGNDKIYICATHEETTTKNVVETAKGSFIPGIDSDLAPKVITEDLGISEATTRTTYRDQASNNNDFNTLQECRNRVDEWIKNKSFVRSVVNESVVANNPNYESLFKRKPIDASANKVVSNSPVIQGAKCSDKKAGVCVAFTNKRQCQVDYQVDYYTVNYRVESTTKNVQDDLNCVEKTEFVSNPMTYSGLSKLNVTLDKLLTSDATVVEWTHNMPRINYECSTGVHLRDIKSKYEFLNKYINEKRAIPNIIKDAEFFAAVQTMWALYVEKSDKVIDADPMGLANILAIHKQFPDATFIGQSNADLGIDSDNKM